MIRGDEPSIFVDQRTFLDRLAASGHQGILAVPGHDHRDHPGQGRRPPPGPRRRDRRHLRRQGRPPPPLPARLARLDRRPEGRLATPRRRRPRGRPAGVVAPAAGDGPDRCGPPSARRACCAPAMSRCSSTSPPARCEPYAGEPYRYRFDVDRAARRVGRCRPRRRLEQLAVPLLPVPRRGARASSTSGSTTSSSRCRWNGCGAPRPRPSAGSIRRPRSSPTSSSTAGSCSAAARTATPTSSVFGEVDGCTLTCTLHGWRFDLETGRCLTSADHPLRVRRHDLTSQRISHLAHGSCHAGRWWTLRHGRS